LLPEDLGHLARNLGGTRENDRTVSGLEDTRVLLDGNHGSERLDGLEFTLLLKVDDVSGVDLLVLGDTLDGKTNGVTGTGRLEHLLVLFDGKDLLVLETTRNKTNDITRAESSLFDGTADDLSNTLNVVNVGDGQTEGRVGLTLGRLDKVVEGIDNSESGDLLLGLEVGFPSLVPGGLVGLLDEVVAVESRVGDEGNLLGLESDHLKHLHEFFLDFVETALVPVAGVHLVDTNDNLLNTEEVEETGVLTGLSFFHSQLRVGLGNGGFETTLLGRHEQETNISGGGTGDHVLDVILVAGGIDDSVVVLVSEELLGVTLDGNTTFTLFLARIEVVSETERRLSLLFSEGLELGHLTIGDSSHLEDQVTASGGLSGIDVTADDEGQMFFLTHGRLVA